VIGFGRGSVPEIVRDGVNGFVVHDVAGAIGAVGRVATLDRGAVRADCEARFSDHAVVDAYEMVYREMVG